jgi:hypothetical protein
MALYHFSNPESCHNHPEYLLRSMSLHALSQLQVNML